MKNTWLYVRPGETGEPVQFDCNDLAERERLLGKRDVDFGSFSPQFHYIVYEHSITDGWSLNWRFMSTLGLVPVCGPALIFKSDAIGDTIDLTPDDIEALRDWIAAARLGLFLDSRSLDNAHV